MPRKQLSAYISIALTMFEQGEVDTAGSMLINVAAFRTC